MSDEEEEKPDEVIEVPTTKVKLIVGQGGETIKFIQKKSKCRLQVEKTEEALEVRSFPFPSFPHSAVRSRLLCCCSCGGSPFSLALAKRTSVFRRG